MEDKEGGISLILVIVIICLLISNHNLKKQVTECGWNIDLLNDSIDQANNDLSSAHEKAWTNYDTMGSALEELDGSYPNQDNPCNPN